MAWRRVSASLTNECIRYDGIEALFGWVFYLEWYAKYRNVTLCHDFWWDLGFGDMKHGLISYNGNQGRGIFHALFFRLSDFQNKWIVFMTIEICVIVSAAPVKVKGQC